ncbi:MAG: glycosyltransferase, partial [Myxococcota bacterium]|nr:glycosyltransferase [Myxococcota bacterium]
MSREDGGIGYVLRRFPKISETFVLNEILALEARGERVTIFSLQPTRDSRFHADLGRLRASVVYVPGPSELRALARYALRCLRARPRACLRALGRVLRSGRPRLLWRLVQSAWVAERVRALRIGHLHAHFATDATEAASLVAEITGLPFSFTAHAVDIYKDGVDERMLAREIAQARFVATVSECNRRHLRRLANGAADRIVRVYNGIDLERFRLQPPPPSEPFTILCVARLVEKKGLDVLVEACALLRERGLALRCRIVGKGARRSALQAQIRLRGLEGVVELLGAHTQSEVLARYAEAHVFALPCVVGSDGNRDGLPVSLVEALACGLPVVTTPVTGIPEVVRHEHNGLVVPDRDPRALADALERVLREPGLHAR